MRLMVMRWDTQIGGSMTGANLEVYSMHDSSKTRFNFSILCDVLSWMIDVISWLLYVKWCIPVII